MELHLHSLHGLYRDNVNFTVVRVKDFFSCKRVASSFRFRSNLQVTYSLNHTSHTERIRQLGTTYKMIKAVLRRHKISCQ